jgi:hypothetical protein
MSLQAANASLRASIVSVHFHPRLYFEPLKLLNFDFNADSDPVFHSNPQRCGTIFYGSGSGSYF